MVRVWDHGRSLNSEILDAPDGPHMHGLCQPSVFKTKEAECCEWERDRQPVNESFLTDNAVYHLAQDED